MTKRHQDKNAKIQKYKMTEKQKDKKKKIEKDKKTEREFNVVKSGQFRTLAMFFISLLPSSSTAKNE